MASDKPKRLPHWNSIGELADYFDTHDMGEHLGQMPEAHLDVEIKRKKYLVAIDEVILSKLAEIAKKKSVSSEQLINSWLKERILENPTH
jgi:hypothetical protein